MAYPRKKISELPSIGATAVLGSAVLPISQGLDTYKITVSQAQTIFGSGSGGGSGTSGTSGSSGSRGTSGTSGSSGTSGTSGSSGTSGASGSSGTSGIGFNPIINPLNNRILTSDGSTHSAVAEANLTFDGSILALGASSSILFATSSTPILTKGGLGWNIDYNTLQVAVDGFNVLIGQEEVVYVRNGETNTLLKGEAVYISGASGDRPTVKRASNIGDSTSARTLGLITKDIAAGANGFCTSHGYISGINLGSYTEGDILYLGATAGTITNIKQTAPNHLVYIGVVVRANAGNGIAYVKVQNGYELDELHDVKAYDKDTLANNSILIWDSTQKLWITATASGISGSSGTSGLSGSSGTSGLSGSSGTSGISGSNGTSGLNGSSGTSGISGSSGTSGIGSSGTSGISGSSGTSGLNGSSGTSGFDGSSGTSGLNGSSGTSGLNGSSGTSGLSGSAGTSGVAKIYIDRATPPDSGQGPSDDINIFRDFGATFSKILTWQTGSPFGSWIDSGGRIFDGLAGSSGTSGISGSNGTSGSNNNLSQTLAIGNQASPYQIILATGSEALPSLSFTGSLGGSTGLYTNLAGDDVRIAAMGQLKWVIGTDLNVVRVPIRGTAGNVSSPGYQFESATSSGMWSSSNELNFSVSGVRRFFGTTAGFSVLAKPADNAINFRDESTNAILSGLQNASTETRFNVYGATGFSGIKEAWSVDRESGTMSINFSLDLNETKITNVATGSNSLDAVNYGQVQSMIIAGSSGTSGFSGSSGTSGESGSSGTSGINGSSGTSGINGSSGTSGTNGSSGTSGTGSATILLKRNTADQTISTGARQLINGMTFSIDSGLYEIYYAWSYGDTDSMIVGLTYSGTLTDSNWFGQWWDGSTTVMTSLMRNLDETQTMTSPNATEFFRELRGFVEFSSNGNSIGLAMATSANTITLKKKFGRLLKQ